MHKNSFLKILKGIFVVSAIIILIFSGWFQLWQGSLFSLRIDTVNALNIVNYWGFESPAGVGLQPTGWTRTITTDTMAGAPEYAALTTTTIYYAGAQSVRGRWTSSGNNQAWDVLIFQNFTPTSTVNAKIRGYYKREYKSNNASETNNIVLEVVSGAAGDGTGGSAVLTAFSDASGNATVLDADFITAPNSGVWSSTTTLSEGTAYTIRIRWFGTGFDKDEYGGAWVDNVELSISPIGLSANGSEGTTTVALSWTQSTRGDGTNALHATTPYKVYKGTASPATFLSTASTNSYTDYAVQGNTTYYYSISDLDTASTDSPSSSEVTILTIPDKPGTPTFASVQSSSLRVNWDAPTGGSSDYRVERAPDSGGSPGAWSGIASTSNVYYDDSGLDAGTTYWYRVRGFNNTGSGEYSGSAATTTLTSATVSCSTAGSPTAFPTLTSSSVYTSSPNTTTTTSCTYAGGCSITINDTGDTSNPGLYKSDAPTRLIPSNTETLAAGTEGYGIQAATTGGGSGNTLTLNSIYDKSGDDVGGLFIASTNLASSTGAYSDRELVITYKAAVSILTYNGDYSDTVTISCVGN